MFDQFHRVLLHWHLVGWHLVCDLLSKLSGDPIIKKQRQQWQISLNKAAAASSGSWLQTLRKSALHVIASNTFWDQNFGSLTEIQDAAVYRLTYLSLFPCVNYWCSRSKGAYVPPTPLFKRITRVLYLPYKTTGYHQCCCASHPSLSLVPYHLINYSNKTLFAKQKKKSKKCNTPFMEKINWGDLPFKKSKKKMRQRLEVFFCLEQRVSWSLA